MISYITFSFSKGLLRQIKGADKYEHQFTCTVAEIDISHIYIFRKFDAIRRYNSFRTIHVYFNSSLIIKFYLPKNNFRSEILIIHDIIYFKERLV